MDRIWIGQHTDNQEGEMGALLRHTTVLLVGQVGNSNSAHCGWSQFKKIKGRKEGGFHKHNDHINNDQWGSKMHKMVQMGGGQDRDEGGGSSWPAARSLVSCLGLVRVRHTGHSREVLSQVSQHDMQHTCPHRDE